VTLAVRIALLLDRLTKGRAAVPDFTVHQYGTDTSGRPIYMTAYMHQWWEGIVGELGFDPTIVQGAWMARVAGGGAAASAGYHDGGGCIDLRVWDRTQTQIASMVHAIRWGGAGCWVRDRTHGGMDPHLHIVLGTDGGLSSGAAWQWLNYLHGGDGLSSGGRDYHPRPSPLVTEPPEALMNGDAMKPEDFDQIRQIVREEVDAVLDTPMNSKDPKGDAVFRGKTIRGLLKDVWRHTAGGKA
jgi:hypothetical protein